MRGFLCRVIGDVLVSVELDRDRPVRQFFGNDSKLMANRMSEEGCTALASATVATVPSASSCGFSSAKREMRCSCGDRVG